MKDLKAILKQNSFVNEMNAKLKAGGVIAFVTDTVWGIGCLPEVEAGIEKIYEIKGRDRNKPLILMSNDEANLLPYVENVSETAKNLMQKYFPGALTLVLKKSDKTPHSVTSQKDTVGIRVPDNEVFKTICELVEGHVLATTSANLSNEISSKTYEEALSSIGDYVDYVFPDYGITAQGKESTVALVNGNEIKVLRQGDINP